MKNFLKNRVMALISKPDDLFGVIVHKDSDKNTPTAVVGHHKQLTPSDRLYQCCKCKGEAWFMSLTVIKQIEKGADIFCLKCFMKEEGIDEHSTRN